MNELFGFPPGWREAFFLEGSVKNEGVVTYEQENNHSYI